MNPRPPGDLENEIEELRARVHRLEDALTRQGILAPSWLAQPAAPAVSLPTAAAPPAQVASPPLLKAPIDGPRAIALPAGTPSSLGGMAASAPQPERSLESRIGSQWFNRIGILAVLIGMAWFLKLAVDNHWIGPAGRVLIGLLSGAGLIAWSERFRARGYPAFSYSLKSIGSGILYLSIWAAFSLFQLIPSSVAFAAMVAVTAFNGYLSWVQDSELLALYAIAGGFGTPLLVSTGENHEGSLFGYMLLLDVTVLILVALRPWARLLFGAFAGTVFYVAGWWSGFYTADQATETGFFIACFFLIFAFAPRLARLKAAGPDLAPAVQTSAWDKLATVLMPLLNAAFAFLAFYGLIDSRHADWAQPWLAVAFAGFYLGLLRLPARGAWRESPQLLAELHLATAVVFLTLAIPLKASGRWLTIGWLAEGAALLWVASRARSGLLRVLALVCLALALVDLMVVNPTALVTPIFNERFATYLAAIAVFAFAGWIAMRSAADEKETSKEFWRGFAVASALIVNLLILIAVSLEIHAFWWNHRWHGQFVLYGSYRMYAQFSYSAFFMVFGAILLALGFSRRSAFLRWQALVLLAVSIGKVFLIDVSELSQGYRILSFLGLGALLLAISFVYQRDWFGLRGRGGQAS
jgi:uncharacterized membrane protein